MANQSPATVTITSSTGPGQTVTAQTFTDVVSLTINFGSNTIRVQRAGANGLQYYDYSVIGTVTWTISNGTPTITFS